MAAFCRGRTAWAKDTRRLEDVLKLDASILTFGALTAALHDTGWLGDHRDAFVLSKDSIRLGGVGYGTKDGKFEALANFHTRLTAVGGGIPTWTQTRSPFFHLLTPVVLERSGRTYRRQVSSR